VKSRERSAESATHNAALGNLNQHSIKLVIKDNDEVIVSQSSNSNIPMELKNPKDTNSRNVAKKGF
jgi:fumarate hydratase class II